MAGILPNARPMQPREKTAALLLAHNVRDAVAIVGVRGYYLDTMGAKGKNDRGIYDDAIFIFTPGAYVSFNANVDPSAFRKHIAALKPGVWRYKVGTHGLSRPRAEQYEALVQAGPVTVVRDGQGEDTGMFGINIHRGGRSTTGSLGCQTIWPDQWPAFIELVKAELHRHALATIPYVLTERVAQ